MARIFKLWLPVILWAGLIFYLSGIPDLKTNLEYDFVLRKFAHTFEYFILTLFFYRAFKGSFALSAFVQLALPAVCALLYACTDEWHQIFVPGRWCSARDVLIDSIGIVLFCAAVKYKPKPAADPKG